MTEPSNETFWARLKPYNERKGHKLQRFSIYSMRFEEKRGWYIVPMEIQLANGRVINLKEKLSQIRQDNDDGESPLAFDVMTEEEAKSLDEAQRREAEERKAAKDANRLEPTELMASADGDTRESRDDREFVRSRGRQGRSRKTVSTDV